LITNPDLGNSVLARLLPHFQPQPLISVNRDVLIIPPFTLQQAPRPDAVRAKSGCIHHDWLRCSSRDCGFITAPRHSVFNPFDFFHKHRYLTIGRLLAVHSAIPPDNRRTFSNPRALSFRPVALACCPILHTRTTGLSL